MDISAVTAATATAQTNSTENIFGQGIGKEGFLKLLIT